MMVGVQKCLSLVLLLTGFTALCLSTGVVLPGHAREATGLETRFYTVRNVPARDILPLVEEFLSDQGTAVADPRTNRIIVSDTPGNLQVLETILDQLDQPQKNIMVEATLIQAGREFLQRIGVDWDAGGRVLIGDADVVFSNGYWFYPLDRDLWARAEVVLEQEETVSRSVSSARVLTLNGSAGRLETGTRVPLPVYTRYGRRTLVYEDVLFRLTVTPRLLSDGKIQLDITVVEDDLGHGHAIERRAVSTQVVVKNDEVLIIGGGEEHEETDSRTGVPLVSDVPILGRFFELQATGSKEATLLLQIHARIME
ncbi:MAG: secretin N-terminal domain-containing protein [Desulfovibrionales bacterium]